MKLTIKEQEEIIKSYGFYGEKGTFVDSESLNYEITRMSYMVASSYSDFYESVKNKIMLFDDFFNELSKYIKCDLEECYYLGNLVKCAKQVYETQDLKEIFSKCISNYEWYLEEDGTKIVHSIKDGINLLENIGDFLVLPEKWFSPTLYKKLGEFLKTFDCKNTSYKKRKAFKNNGKFSNNQILEIGNKLNGVSLSTKFNYYPTPDILVDVVQELAEITDSCTILEPSAGTGSLLKGLNKDNIKCVELNEILAEILKSSKYNCTCSEIENYEPKERFDRIIMNPPFQKRLDAKHILLCFNKFLKENGILVAIHSHGILSNTDKYSKEFQDLCRKYAVYHKSYVSGLFKDSGKGTAIPITVTKFVKK